jgi:sterol desaturase/sphingolipid hydroxylase (fatty acid hydroxylase superfamily)
VNWLIENEALLRLAAFAGLLLLLLIWQRAAPARGDSGLARRQGVNIGLVVIDTLILRLAFPVLAVGLALHLNAHGDGLFNRIDWPLWLAIPVAVLILDLAVYWQHRLMHSIPLLWRLHRVHHSDTGFDVTTGVRFHPFEIAVSMAIKLGLVWVLGPHPAAVVIFELLLSLGSLFTHTDVALPKRLDRGLRWVLVTPSMHRIHHSVRREETDSNFGFHLSVWDRLFRSYRDSPALPETTMPIGLDTFRGPGDQTLVSLLRQPFLAGLEPDSAQKNR